ncbi:metallophosphoesterase [Tamlana sp. 2_MG-2023]|uniref:metallophosphoesterase n=1 Tax=unclassified Tamlana TaxID=2614803 RepID=UPI0026E193C2|nr:MULTISPECIES: metallophosphoesterase [unclassified Tamlana]MDO6761060.1 metallophosphoesterase [Tamlana sp. 2_MG-2023]MDO6791607.1 metallophosphoesterase [Tamlana sp. 1_MG-2023]
MLRWIIFIVIFLVADFYAFQAFKTVTKNNILQILYWVITLFVLGNFVFHFYGFNRSDGFSHAHGYAVGFLIATMVPFIFLVGMMFMEDVFRVPQAIYRYFTVGDAAKGDFFTSRRQFISKLALGIAAIPLASIIYGIYKGRYNYKVLKYTMYFEDLPAAFDGYKLTQISDIHSGSFDDMDKVKYAVELINEQASDVILFTGDMVNNKAEELLPYKPVFGKLKAKDGLYSVLGNHDYGDYVKWDSDAAQKQNLDELKAIQKEIGFNMLLNETKFLEKNGERIALVGVENWGSGGFKQAGDLKKASEYVKADDFKILMSHDPTHWEKKVIQDDYHYHLTLSGHTHGMQFGIEIPGWFRWSPAKWRYKYWAGIYEEMGQFINVNRGFGYLAFPGRVGIWPEITVIELKKGTAPA